MVAAGSAWVDNRSAGFIPLAQGEPVFPWGEGEKDPEQAGAGVGWDFFPIPG